MPTHDILTAIDRLKSLAICIVESQEAIDESADLEESLFAISDKIQAGRDLMSAFSSEFAMQEIQIMRLFSEWHKETFPETHSNEMPVAHEYNPLKGNGSAYELLRA